MCRNTFPSGLNSCRFCQWKKNYSHTTQNSKTLQIVLSLALFFYTNPQSICVSAWSQTRDLSCVSQMCKSLHCGVQLVNLIDIGLNCFRIFICKRLYTPGLPFMWCLTTSVSYQLSVVVTHRSVLGSCAQLHFPCMCTEECAGARKLLCQI